MRTLGRILKATFLGGLIGFLPGFCGPMIFAPDANQGPLVGILYTGPAGLAAGLMFGMVREAFRRA